MKDTHSRRRIERLKSTHEDPRTSRDMSYMSMRVNGSDHRLHVENRATLLDVLRERLDLTGAKEGCGIGICGSCTVLLNGMPVKSCTVLAVQADGGEVATIEGLEVEGRLHPLQQAFLDEIGFQCAFCTPGFIMTAKALLDSDSRPTVEQVKRWLDGNICRCSNYPAIIRAVIRAATG